MFTCRLFVSCLFLMGIGPLSFYAVAADSNKKPKRKTAQNSVTPLPQIRNSPQSQPQIKFRMSDEQISSAALWIDRFVGEGLKKAGLQPNPPADDFVFLRRIYLDAAGRIPTDDESADFLSDKDPEKRRKLIDRLLLSDGYRSHFFNWLADLLRHKQNVRRTSYNHYERWLKDQIALNRPWDEMVFDMLSAEGSVAQSGPAGYLLRDPGMPLDNLSNTLTIFLGANVACAQCHDHPLADWTQREYFELAAFFGATDVSDRDPRKVGNKLRNEQLSKQDVIQAVAPNLARVRTKSHQTLRFPDDYAYDDVKPGSRVEPLLFIWESGDEKGPAYAVDHQNPKNLRASFAQWLTHEKNPRFAATIANRLWQRSFGLGVQEPLEDLDDLSKSANPALLQLLGQVMVKAGFDLREFQRVLFNSRTYQAKSSVTPEIGKSEQYLFPGPVLRRMTAEQTWDSILALVIGEKLDDYKIDRSHRVTRYQFPFDQMSDSEVTKMVLSMKKSGHLTKGNGSRLNELDYVNGKRPLKIGSQFLLRASEMQQPAKDDHFLRMFGQSSRELVNDSSSEGSIPQTLMLMNGEVQAMLADKESRLSAKLKKSGGLRPAVEFLFLSFFGRPPTPDEFEAIEESLRSGMKKEDLTWALFNSTEFLFVQ
ncbi:MAG: DUF1549 domain-containing protein [Verrucomicrobiota bacterium]|nr:DUF1549 domain-containing protein [Verrucomicrobiota bacterium]